MITTLECPSCRLPVAAAAESSAHRSAEGSVRYLRCACGQWVIAVGDRPIAVAGAGPES